MDFEITMKKVVIYTSIVGNYDPLIEHRYISRDWDYICFVDENSKISSKFWKIIKLPSEIKDKVKLSRLPKILPHKFVSEYEYSIYIDANLEITNDRLEKRINQLIQKESVLALVPHPYRDCVYDEADFCIQIGKDNSPIIKQQIKEIYINNKFPRHYGLYQNNLIFRKHNELGELGELWWDVYLKYSRRDQLSLIYALWKTDIRCDNLFEKGYNVKTSPDGFICIDHEVPFTTNKKKYVRIRIRSWLRKLGILQLIQKTNII